MLSQVKCAIRYDCGRELRNWGVSSRAIEFNSTKSNPAKFNSQTEDDSAPGSPVVGGMRSPAGHQALYQLIAAYIIAGSSFGAAAASCRDLQDFQRSFSHACASSRDIIPFLPEHTWRCSRFTANVPVL
jgi:hypothetical protein